MYRNLIFILIILALFPISSLKAATDSNYERLFYMAPGKNGMDTFKANAKYIDIVAPQTYVVDANLNASGTVNAEIKKIAKENGVEIMPLVVNANFNEDLMHKILTAPTSKQDKIIDYLVKEAIKNDYVGWQFDFEHILWTDNKRYSEFVERASRAFKKNDLLFSVAVIVRDANTDPKSEGYKHWSGVFDYERLANASDFISVMTYDDPKSLGPVASMPFVESSFNYLKTFIPPHKISLGVPLYYWGWSEKPFVRVRKGGTFERLAYLRQTFKVIEGFDYILKVPYLQYSVGKDRYIVWHEDKQSLAYKMDFIKKNNLRGFSAWVLGVENPNIWDLMKTEALARK